MAAAAAIGVGPGSLAMIAGSGWNQNRSAGM